MTKHEGSPCRHREERARGSMNVNESETEMMNDQQIKNAARELVECEGTEPEFLSVTEMWPDATEDEWNRIYDTARTAGVNL